MTRINWYRIVLASSIGYGVLFVAARTWLPPQSWTRGKTVAVSLYELAWDTLNAVSDLEERR